MNRVIGAIAAAMFGAVMLAGPARADECEDLIAEARGHAAEAEYHAGEAEIWLDLYFSDLALGRSEAVLFSDWSHATFHKGRALWEADRATAAANQIEDYCLTFYE